MKVSLKRKTHIMAFPQGTSLNARWSDDQSAATPAQPAGRARTSPVSSLTVACAIGARSSSVVQQHREQHQPDQQQEMPVDGAQLDAQAHLVRDIAAVAAVAAAVAASPYLRGRPAEGNQAAEQVQSVHGGEQVEEGT